MLTNWSNVEAYASATKATCINSSLGRRISELNKRCLRAARTSFRNVPIHILSSASIFVGVRSLSESKYFYFFKIFCTHPQVNLPNKLMIDF